MEGIARDDEEALAALIAELGPSLNRFVLRTLRSPRQESEEVVQEVFIRAWKARHRWRPEASVKTYLFTIASRLCLNRVRGMSRAPQLLAVQGQEGHPAFELAYGAPDPERALLSRQIGAAVEREIDALPANQRAALLLRHSEEMSYQEIAVVLDTSAAAVESLLSRARARLRVRLSPWAAEGRASQRG